MTGSDRAASSHAHAHLDFPGSLLYSECCDFRAQDICPWRLGQLYH